MATRQFLNNTLFVTIRLYNVFSCKSTLPLDSDKTATTTHLTIANNKLCNGLQNVFLWKIFLYFLSRQHPVQLLLFPLLHLVLCSRNLWQYCMVTHLQVLLFTLFLIQIEVTTDMLAAGRFDPTWNALHVPFFLMNFSSLLPSIVGPSPVQLRVTHLHSLHQCPSNTCAFPFGRTNFTVQCSENIMSTSSAFRFFIATFSDNDSPSVSSSLYNWIRLASSQNDSCAPTFSSLPSLLAGSTPFEHTSMSSSSTSGMSTCSRSETQWVHVMFVCELITQGY